MPMERLTFDGNCTQKEVWERLKAYEDAGL